MATSKKILILHASAGHGHEKAALAVAEALAQKGIVAPVRDCLELVHSRFGRMYKNSYLSMIKSAPALWGFSYYSTDMRVLGPAVRPVRRLVNGWAADGVRRYLDTEKPDAIVCTHFMSVEVAGTMKRRGEFKGKIVTVVTDYLAHSFWVDRSTDIYTAGSEQTFKDLKRRGVPGDKIRITGIPVSSAFCVPPEREAFRARLALTDAVPTVLLASGGAGVGPIAEMARELTTGKTPFQTLVVCGTNKALYERLSGEAKTNGMLRVFGFVNNMHELMSAADLLVGKAGGLTLAECFCQGLPIVMVRPVPGQEGRNALVVTGAGAGVTTRTAPETLRVARSILGNRPRLSEMREAARRLGRPDAARAIAELALL